MGIDFKHLEIIPGTGKRHVGERLFSAFSDLEEIPDSFEGTLDVMAWTEKNRLLSGKPFRYDDAGVSMMRGEKDGPLTTAPRPYLNKVLKDTVQDKSIIKCRQSEFTESEISDNIYLSCTRPNTMVRHIFPIASVANQVAKERIHPSIMNSPSVRVRLLKPISLSSHGFSNGSFYTVASSYSETGGRGPTSDKITFDEYESQNEKIEEIFGESTSHSTLARRTRISTPMFPGGGIDARFSDATGHEWWLVCPRCHKRQQMTFPDSIIGFFEKTALREDEGSYQKRLDKVYIGCKFCKEYIDRTSPFYLKHSGWYARRPSLEGLRHSYRVTYFMLPWKTGKEILYKYHGYRYVHQFWNEVVGYAYVGEDANIPRASVEACSDPSLANSFMKVATVKNTAIGIDWGPTVSWVVVMGDGVPGNPDTPSVIYMERIDKESLQQHGFSGADTDHVGRAGQIIDRFSAGIVVNDANGIGNDRNSILIRRYKMRAYGLFYDTDEKQKQKKRTKVIEPMWILNQNKVTVSRTGTLKLILKSFREKDISFPRLDPLTTVFVDHICALAVERIEDPTTGAEYEVVGKIGPDHFAHAYNYARIGYDRMTGRDRGGGVPGVI